MDQVQEYNDAANSVIVVLQGVQMLLHVTIIQMQKQPIMDHVNSLEGLDCDGNCLSGDAVTINMFDSWRRQWMDH